jgi:hypothetical protein
LWEKVFGGYNSANFIMDSQGNKTLSTSACNSSSELLYKAYCKTGYRSYKDGVVLSGSSVKQIMKDCAIDYIVTEGAIK